MSRAVWFNCCAGVAGDMLLGSLVDAGAERSAVIDSWASLGVDGYSAVWEPVQRCGIRSLRAVVTVDVAVGGDHAHVHRPARDVLDLIGSASLHSRVRDRALDVYRTLAEVEGAVHGTDAGDVELHEVGALDSILDVVGVCAALESLDIDLIAHSPIAVGHGSIATAHGRLPNPAPAVTSLFARGSMPTIGIDTTMELATPTGVALLAVLGTRRGQIPDMTVAASGFGAGKADPEGRPNVVQAVVGTSTRAAVRPDPGRPARLVEVNVDDATGEVLAHAVAAILAAGAHDAWVTPIVMKKGRPGQTVHALCDDAAAGPVTAAMLAETGSLGVRSTSVERWPQRRVEVDVEVGGHPIRVKVSDGRVKVEHDDAADAARALGRPLRDVLAAAEYAYRSGPDADAPTGP
jgi:uncharacterized protein (TIGR00299 family) protein